MDLSYMGFTQEAGIRLFRFECQIQAPRPASTPRRVVQFVVSADMSLFLQYSIPIQDGPVICRGVLAEATATIPENELVSGSFLVQESYIASFAAARTADAQAKSVRRHKPPVRPARVP